MASLLALHRAAVSASASAGLAPGESTEVQGSGAKPYIVKHHLDGAWSCSCPAWRMQPAPADARTCKHVDKVRGVKPTSLVRLQAQSTVKKPATKKQSGDPTEGGVLLAEKWTPAVDPTGYWMSEKLDGLRAYWNGEGLYSRNGNRFAAPDSLLSLLSEVASCVSLDGELYVGPGLFNEASSIVRSSVPDARRWKRVRYMVFDAPNVPGGFEQRVLAVKAVVAEARRQSGDPCPIAALEQVRCRGPEHLGTFHAEVVSRGVEGTMLRAPGSPYARRRSADLLKVKDFHDAEAIVVGYVAGEGKHRGRLGAYEVEDEATGVGFRVGTGLSDRDRERRVPVGTVITYRYQELTPAGVPRFPSFVRVRGRE